MSQEQYEKDIALAAAANAFLYSPLGQRIEELAGQEIDRCLGELKTVDPEDVKTVRRLQDSIRRNETLGAWIVEIIHAGNEAKNILAGEEG
jgi:hypothetical protein